MKIIGKYFILMGTLFVRRERFKIYFNLTLEECLTIGIESIFLVAIISSFIGAVTCIQTSYNLISPLVPKYTIASVVRDMTLLELAPTFTCVILAGKIGSNIASQLGTMRITEQIDALEVMGINSASYLILPKILASIIMFPMLVTLAAFLSMFGGYIAGTMSGALTDKEYIYGLQEGFNYFNIPFPLIKGFVFAFLTSSISAFQGYYTKGGAFEVGKSSTEAVVKSCIAILLADYFLAEILL